MNLPVALPRRSAASRLIIAKLAGGRWDLAGDQRQAAARRLPSAACRRRHGLLDLFIAKPEHIEWLLEGVESWNRRREQQDFKPDLVGANIYEEFQRAAKLDDDGSIPLSGINLSRANLRDCRLWKSLRGADLRQANLWAANLQSAQLNNSILGGAALVGTRFDNANLNGASLRDIRTGSTSFRGTSLRRADLTDAQMNNASLRDAYLSCATLKGTDLTGADLTGADLSWSRPWQAKLFQDNPSTARLDTQSGQSKRITCVADLIKECAELEALYSDSLLYLRGEHTNT